MRFSRTLLALLLLAGVLGCKSLGGTFDHSRSLVRAGEPDGRSPIAVLPPPEEAQMPGLEVQIERAVSEALRSDRDHEVVPAKVFYERLARNKGYQEHFISWLVRYRETGILEKKSMPAYAKASSVRYLLLLRDAEIRRERMDVRSAMEEAQCGVCRVNPDNIWGNRLIVLAELHDLSRGEVIWKGIGEANVITSRASKLDFGVVQYNLRQPSLGTHSAQLVAYVANGIARGINGSSGTSLR